MRCGWRMNSPPLRIASALRSARRRKQSDDMRHCKNAWMIGMPLIPMCMQPYMHRKPLRLPVNKCSPPDQPILQAVKQQFNRHNRCILKDNQLHRYKGSQPSMDNLCLLCSHLGIQAQYKPMERPSSHLCIRHMDLHNKCTLHQL